MLEVISNQHLIKKERTGRMQKPRIPLHPTTKTRNIVFSSDGVSCAEKDEKKESQLVRKTCFSDANMGL